MLMMLFDDALTRADSNSSFVYFLQFYLLKFFFDIFQWGSLNPQTLLWLRHWRPQ